MIHTSVLLTGFYKLACFTLNVYLNKFQFAFVNNYKIILKPYNFSK